MKAFELVGMGCTGSSRSGMDVKGRAKKTFFCQQGLCGSLFVAELMHILVCLLHSIHISVVYDLLTICMTCVSWFLRLSAVEG
jgi:hypothetical protein